MRPLYRARPAAGRRFRGAGRERWDRDRRPTRTVRKPKVPRASAVARLHNLGCIRREQGNRALSEERLTTSLSLCREIGARYLHAETLYELGSIRAEVGDPEAAREFLESARKLACEVGVTRAEVLAPCELACLPGGDAADAVEAVRESWDALRGHDRPFAKLLLFRATGERRHLADAKRLLDDTWEGLDDSARAAALDNAYTSRQIMAAWRDELGEESETPDEAAS